MYVVHIIFTSEIEIKIGPFQFFYALSHHKTVPFDVRIHMYTLHTEHLHSLVYIFITYNRGDCHLAVRIGKRKAVKEPQVTRIITVKITHNYLFNSFISINLRYDK